MENKYSFVGKECLVTTKEQGIWFGTLLSEGDSLEIKDPINIAQWQGAASLSQLSVQGSVIPEHCTFIRSKDQTKTLEEVGEIIFVLPTAAKMIKEIADGYKEKEKQFVMVESAAGIFFGYLEERKDSYVVLTKVRRVFKWNSYGNLENLPKKGVCIPSGCMFTIETDLQKIFKVTKVSEVAPIAKKSIDAVPPWMASQKKEDDRVAQAKLMYEDMNSKVSEEKELSICEDWKDFRNFLFDIKNMQGFMKTLENTSKDYCLGLKKEKKVYSLENCEIFFTLGEKRQKRIVVKD